MKALLLFLLISDAAPLLEHPVCHPHPYLNCDKLDKEIAWFCRCGPPPAPRERRI